MSIAALKNLGPASAKMLEDAEIRSLDDLRDLGPVVSFLAVRQIGHRPSLNLLWSIYGAIHDIHWMAVTEQQKLELTDELDRLTK